MNKRVLSSFSVRLAECCVDLGLKQERGRISALARMFNVTPNAAKKWLTGEGMPELAKAVEIASRANVSIIWLLQGAGPKTAPARDPLAEAVGHAVSALPQIDGTEVADFVRYKIERTEQSHIAAESKSRYLAEIDKAVLDRRTH